MKCILKINRIIKHMASYIVYSVPESSRKRGKGFVTRIESVVIKVVEEKAKTQQF